MKKIILILLMVSTWYACSDLVKVATVDVEGRGASYAFPILNSDLNIVDLGNNINDQTYVEVKPDGKLVVHYDGEVNTTEAVDVFPTFPILNPEDLQPVYWEIPDTNYHLSLGLITNVFDEDGKVIVKKSIYRNTSLIFDFTSPFDEPLTITVTMPGMVKDGQDFVQVYTVPALAIGYRTEKVSLIGWTLESDNYIPFIYDARKQNGERVKLTVSVNMDFYDVSYTEGYFGQNSFNIDEDEIDIGVFKKWKSGGFSFEDPIINLIVDNSFGFPVRAKVENITFTTINDVEFELESELIDQGIDFNYPGLGEVGKVVNSFFTFDKTNSNVKALFNDKVKKLVYDIDASANPTGDSTIIGFIDESSYFRIHASVILPLEMTIDELVLVDTFDISIGEQQEKVTSAQFKLVNQNKLPFDLKFQCYFLNQNNVVDSLFSDGALSLEACDVDGNGAIIPGEEIITFIEMDKARYTKLKLGTKLAIEIKIDSKVSSDQSVWLKEDHGLLTKLGVIVNIGEG